MKKIKLILIGVLTGTFTGLFGSGGGCFTVPFFESAGLSPQNAHATSLAVTLPFAIISSIFYSTSADFDLAFALKFIPFGILGAYVGSKILKKISTKALKKLFGIIMIIAGVKTFLR